MCMEGTSSKRQSDIDGRDEWGARKKRVIQIIIIYIQPRNTNIRIVFIRVHFYGDRDELWCISLNLSFSDRIFEKKTTLQFSRENLWLAAAVARL